MSFFNIFDDEENTSPKIITESGYFLVDLGNRYVPAIIDRKEPDGRYFVIVVSGANKYNHRSAHIVPPSALIRRMTRAEAENYRY